MGFTNLSDTQISGLVRADANPAEWAVYIAVTRAHNLQQYPGNPSWCYRSIADIARITGYHPDTCKKALRGLRTKEFLPGVTVLARVGGGHRGQATVNDDQLWSYSELMEQEPMPPKGGPLSPPYQEQKGGPLSPPIESAERGAQTTGKGGADERKGGLNDRKGGPLSPPQNRKTEEIDRTEIDREVIEEGTGMVDSHVGRGEQDSDEGQDWWPLFLDWIHSHNFGSLRHFEAAKLYKRAGKKRRAHLDEWFGMLDEVAATYPLFDDELDPVERATVDGAVHEWVNGNVTVFGVWALLSLHNHRECGWIEFV